MVALVVASVSEPVPVVSRPRDTGVTSNPLPTTTILPSRLLTSATTTTTSEPTFNPFVGLLVQVIAVLVALLLLVAAVVLVQALVQRRPHLVRSPEASFDLAEVPEELLRTARSRMDLLETGEPRNAIVAAWLSLEEAAAATGLPRHPSETSSEYTERVLGTWPVDGLALSDLAGLYREARFSRHDLGEPARARAIAALRVLHSDLDRVPRPAHPGEPTG